MEKVIAYVVKTPNSDTACAVFMVVDNDGACMRYLDTVEVELYLGSHKIRVER